ncbi:hypothetical protein AMTR_s00040p00234890 [Amborella trichopoda]|uniref:Uncharacterized protein n=1 Tax=Amborella trichopoda TaxID=13333 RepID=W1PZ14_AMBTC|nr:hypothetical protein AMTR_s00040p00234890 [Amborella trichopoda]
MLLITAALSPSDSSPFFAVVVVNEFLSFVVALVTAVFGFYSTITIRGGNGLNTWSGAIGPALKSRESATYNTRCRQVTGRPHHTTGSDWSKPYSAWARTSWA